MQLESGVYQVAYGLEAAGCTTRNEDTDARAQYTKATAAIQPAALVLASVPVLCLPRLMDQMSTEEQKVIGLGPVVPSNQPLPPDQPLSASMTCSTAGS